MNSPSGKKPSGKGRLESSASPKGSGTSKRKLPPKKSVLAAISAQPLSSQVEAEEGIAAFQREARDLEIERERVSLVERRHHLWLEHTYARRTFHLVAGWIYLVLALLLFQGFGSSYRYFHFHLSDTVLEIAIGSTTLNVIGMLVIVLKGVFPSQKHQS